MGDQLRGLLYGRAHVRACPVKNGEAVAAFEREFAQYVGARYAIALCNGTATLHTALVALGVKSGDRVAVPPLTMSATTIAVLHAGAVPVFVDVDPDTWLMAEYTLRSGPELVRIPVSLYGLHSPWWGSDTIDDAAQTLRPHGGAAFTSYSFQASKILPLGEGGMLVTNDEELANRAREFSSLGYRMRPDQPRIDPAVLKNPTYERHHTLGWNYRMNDVTAEAGLRGLYKPRLPQRRWAANLYREAIAGCDWLTPQHVPEGWSHDYWAWTVALADSGSPFVEWHNVAAAIERHGGERPYAAWRLTYHEPAFRRYVVQLPAPVRDDGEVSLCPVAEDLQPRLMQFQTNSLAAAENNAHALRKAIRELGG